MGGNAWGQTRAGTGLDTATGGGRLVAPGRLDDGLGNGLAILMRQVGARGGLRVDDRHDLAAICFIYTGDATARQVPTG